MASCLVSVTLFSRLSSQFQASLVAQLVENLPAMQETRVRSLGWEDPLENKMGTLAWKISEGPGGCSPWGCKESGTTE